MSGSRGQASATPRAMKRRCVVAAAVLCAVALAACEREQRQFEVPPAASVAVKSLRMSTITPGGPAATPNVVNPYEDNAYALAEGKRLFTWYNCVGCHAQGGGGQGPALMDATWIYGSAPANVFATIVQGRPNGMPAFGGRIPENEVWELVAYVRSLSGLVDKTAAPSRSDERHAKPAENRVDTQTPVPSSTPPASEHPS
jgi:cytochrome c oxidase cbb3-type subunit 3